MADEITRETWRTAVGWEGYYEVSDQGRVRSLDRTVVARNRQIRLRGQLRKTSTGRPYPMVVLSRPGVRTTESVHALVLTAFVGPRPEGNEACHGIGGPTDNRLSNLRWDTLHENNLDKVRHGTHQHSPARQTCCKRGHLLLAPNLCTGDLSRGWRKCLSCHNARGRVSRTGVGSVDRLADAYYRGIVRRSRFGPDKTLYAAYQDQQDVLALTDGR